ncbi:shikimate dehydrogenase [Cellulosimicrobium marinum]|uniref:shikimate dehydrogenase n=1 Tax=Cellulosimicrobium marinum TaxID=1638992 RepID=UPI001E582567|nr:shikimate dehydrogenase [Cellulosimicrobium marinum]MCB7137584.1 shikimate dehydrogenase [Cellulosimicrobium marinum]
MTSSSRRAAVLGHPVAHSLSPVLHRAAYAALGLDDWRYDAVDTTEEQLPAFVSGLDASWAGLSLTMPLKHAVIPLLDHVDPLASVVGAVNTLVVQPTGGRRPTFVGTNTDVHGLVAALREGLGERTVRSAVVLGAGATAASTLAALAELGCVSPTVLVRSLGRTGGLQRAAHRMGVEPRFSVLDPADATVLERVAAADVVVATLPSRAADPVADALATAFAGPVAAPGGVLLDVVYDPRPTALSAAWAAAGGTAVGGERMLLHQAAEQVRLMTGRPAPLGAMDHALEDALVRA